MVKSVAAFFRNYGRFVAIGGVIAALLLLTNRSHPDSHVDLAAFQRNFLAEETRIDAFTAKAFSTISKHGIKAWVRANPVSDETFLHVYRHDSLVYWNTNELPVYHLADLHFPVEGLVHLQNGWYYTHILSNDSLIVVGSFRIQHTYPYENEQLRNNFNPRLTTGSASLTPEHREGAEIHAKKGQFLFSLEHWHHPKEAASETDNWIFLLFLLAVVLVWESLNHVIRRPRFKLLLAVAFVLLRIWSLEAGWFSGWSGNELFDPSVLALSEQTPNMGELLFSFVVFLFVVNAVIHNLKQCTLPPTVSRWMLLLGVLLFPFLAGWMSRTGMQIVENSSIPLQLDELFSLTRYSLLVLGMIGIAGFAFAALARRLFLAAMRANGNKLLIVGLWIIANAIYLLLQGEELRAVGMIALWPTLLGTVVLFIAMRQQGVWSFSNVLVILLLFATATASSIRTFADIKEREERELYANQLSDDKDIATEIEYLPTRRKLLEDPYLKRLSSPQDRPAFSALKEAMERRVFNGFWERYDIDFFYYALSDSAVSMNGKKQEQLEQLINRHGQVSEMDSCIFFIKDYTSQYSYIIRERIGTGESAVWLYCTLKSKKIPEEIGFPRLLISDKAKVFESLQSYSIAKYYRGRLVTKYGSYVYPYTSDALFRISGTNKSAKFFFDADGYNHLLLRKTDLDIILLSKKTTSWLDWVTTVAFLFVSYGAFLAIFVFIRTRDRRIAFRKLSLAVKIQVVLVGLVVLSLLGFSIGSGTFIQAQYASYTNDIVREKIHSVGIVSKLRLGDVQSINAPQERGDLEYYLRNWSQIFVTDVNIYDLNGMLVASSRPKIYNIGLLGEQMNPEAKRALKYRKQSEFIHQERIGNLRYLSAYLPFFNNEGRLVAYLNLQHFDHQDAFESQIQRFLVAIINVFMLLLALSIVGAIVVSGWLTSPLRMIQRSFAKVELGKNNQVIDYQSNDEIGELVRQYNRKLVELEEAVLQLAQSERESAWREMAKQVAHEIKNPLTPMKLSIQQLQRVFDPNDPNSKQKIDRVSQSIIEQIDALASIANAFANFAKMPQPKMERIELRAFLESLVAVYELEEGSKVQLETTVEEVFMEGDREMLLRVINNLVTNAMQSIPSERSGLVTVSLLLEEHTIIIFVTDNGCGIPAEQLNTIFEPYFTTKSTGTGLGLAMVKQIVEGHSGTIEVVRTDASGTRMELRFPQVK